MPELLKGHFTKHHSFRLAFLYLQTHLGLKENWYTKYKFKVTQSKSAHTTLKLRQVPCPNVQLNGISIPSSSTVKYLGLTLDRRLTWGHYIREKILSLNNLLRMLKHFIGNKVTTIY